MTIAIEAGQLSVQPRGIGYFLLNALQEIARIKQDWHFIFLSNRPLLPPIVDTLNNYSNIKIYIRPLKILPNRWLLWFLICFPKILNQMKIDLLWSPMPYLPINYKGKTIVTVHDVVHIEYPHTMGSRIKSPVKFLINRSINRSDKLWAVSNYTAGMIKKYYPKRKSKDIVVGSSVNMSYYKKINVEINEKLLLLEKLEVGKESRVLLFIGTLEPRKNLKYLLSLVPNLAKKGYELIVVGGNGWGKTEIVDIINTRDYPIQKVHFAGYLTNEELLKLYNIADCFVSTSLNEGFGMPQLEAISCGMPVVTADNSAMSEVVGGAGLLVKGWDKNEWIKCIEQAIDCKDELIARYPKKLKDYEWNGIAQRVAEYIEK